MNPVLQTIYDRIVSAECIMIFRHVRIDGDCVGSTKGLKRILQLTYPEKEVYLVDSECSAYLSFLGADDGPVSDKMYTDALAIVIDTGTAERVSNQKFRLCKEIVKIDHHIPMDSYGDYEWVEEHRSSACEMIAHFYATFRDELKINKEAAYYIYTGMVTDSGRFRFRSVRGDTLRLAGLLLDQGIDTENLYANLYLENFEYLKFKAYVYEHMQTTENGVTYLFVTREMQKKFNLSLEDASASVSFMDSIKGSICWIAFIEQGDEQGTIRVRLRSRFVPINTVAEQFRGGGHDCACGSTVYNMDEVNALLTMADETVRKYKETHEDWL